MPIPWAIRDERFSTLGIFAYNLQRMRSSRDEGPSRQVAGGRPARPPLTHPDQAYFRGK
jgi:hypothetical protein